MTDETSAVPTSADIEAIRQRDYETRHSPFIVGGGQAIEDRCALLAAIDGERRQRADLERQLEEAQNERDHWKANHAEQVRIKRHLHDMYEELHDYARAKDRQLEDTARALVLFGGHRVTCEYAERCTCGFDVARDEAARRLARPVVQEAETP